MTSIPATSFCLGIPVDHRIQGLPIPANQKLGRHSGRHAQILTSYGDKQYGRVSEEEIDFARWLALPGRKGGVVIVLLQPAQQQRYFADHAETVRDCETLNAVDEICRKVAGYGLESVSCFDAFPFQKVLWNKRQAGDEADFDMAYGVFLQMIHEKQPDAILACYTSPHPSKYKHFDGQGIGKVDRFRSCLNGECYECFNGFHPSFAINFRSNISILRQLLVLTFGQAFAYAYNHLDWVLPIPVLSATCTQIVKECQDLAPTEEHIFNVAIDSLRDLLIKLGSNYFDRMGDDELYKFILEKRYNIMVQDCLLTLDQLVYARPKTISRFRDLDFENLSLKEELQQQTMDRTIKKGLMDLLLQSLSTTTPYQLGGQGLFVPSMVEAYLNARDIVGRSAFGSRTRFYNSLQSCARTLLLQLNLSFSFYSINAYELDLQSALSTLCTAANSLEITLKEHYSKAGASNTDPFDLAGAFKALNIGHSGFNNNHPARTIQIPAASASGSFPAASFQSYEPRVTIKKDPTGNTQRVLSKSRPYSLPATHAVNSGPNIPLPATTSQFFATDTKTQYPLPATFSPSWESQGPPRSTILHPYSASANYVPKPSSIPFPTGYSNNYTSNTHSTAYSTSRIAPCTACGIRGHSSVTCPTTQCYRCKPSQFSSFLL